VILAGHSMGGIAITQAAENCPKHIGALVVNPTTTIPRDDGTIAFKPEHSREAFYGDCTMKTRRSPSHAWLPSPLRLLEHP